MSESNHAETVLLRATAVFENADYAAAWLDAPNLTLGGNSPRSLIETEEGLQAVLRALVAVEYGLPL